MAKKTHNEQNSENPDFLTWDSLHNKLNVGPLTKEVSNLHTTINDILYVEMLLIFLYTHDQPYIGSQWPILRNFRNIEGIDNEWAAILSEKIPNRYIAKSIWLDACEKYFNLNQYSSFPLFEMINPSDIVFDSTEFKLKTGFEELFEFRKSSYFSFLKQEVKQNIRVQASVNETYYFWQDENRGAVHLPIINDLTIQKHTLPKRMKDPEFSISIQEILNYCKEMDKISESKNLPEIWTNIFEQMELRSSNGSIVDHLSIKNTTHLVGVVSSGKSTLIKIFCYAAYRRNQHLTIVVSDVGRQMELFNQLELLGVPSLPLIGKTRLADRLMEFNRRQYSLYKFHKKSITELMSKREYRYLNDTCLLNSFINDGETRVKKGNEPCERLYKSPKTKHYCPYQQICPRYNDIADLFEIKDRPGVSPSIWIVNPYSLVMNRIPSSFNESRPHLLDFAYNHSNAIIIDEADLVQLQFESMFAEGQPLEGRGKDRHTLDDMNLSAAEVSRDFRSINSPEELDFTDQIFEIQRLFNKLNFFFNEKTHDPKHQMKAMYLYKEVKGRVFTPLSLLKTLIYRYSTEDSEQEFPIIDEDCANVLLSKFQAKVRYRNNIEEIFFMTILNRDFDNDEKLINYLPEPVSEYYSKLPELENNYNNLIQPSKENFILNMRFILIIAKLDYLIRKMVYFNENIGHKFRIDLIEKYPISKKVIPRLSNIIPYPISDKLFGYQYEDKKLQVRIFGGNGRFLMHQLYKLFEDSEGRVGLPVLITSATSWVTETDKFNISIPPTYYLKANVKTIEMLKKSKIFYAPIGDDPIRVSGTGSQRYFHISHLVKDLIKNDEYSILQQIINKLPNNRKNLLLVVGSYEEGKEVLRIFKDSNHWNSKILRLISDGEYNFSPRDSIRRSAVETMRFYKKSLLIAPLLSIERGYNILNDENLAYFGGIIFLTRPVPIPFDLSIQVSLLNEVALRVYFEGPRDKKWFEYGRDAIKRSNKIESWYNNNQTYFKLTDKEWKEYVIASMTVLIWQTIGRTIRNHQDTQVYFMDAAFVEYDPKEVIHPLKNKDSFLVMMRNFLITKANSSDIIDRELFGAIAHAFEEIEEIRL